MIICKMKFIPLILIISAILTAEDFTEKPVPPAEKFSLKNWKLQIPGPEEIKDLDGYYSKYFFLNRNGEMCFSLDSSESGSTKNSIYVRSELRHLSNWRAGSFHKLTATLRVDSGLNPDRLTVLQVHGFTVNGSSDPVLLRIAANNGDLYAHINTSGRTKGVLLAPGIGRKQFRCEITVNNNFLIIEINGERKINLDISSWKIQNYFKAGCYPQSHTGKATVIFRELRTE